MSNYIYTNEGLVKADELMHYGVPGMRWGRRKSGYVTIRNANRNARRAAIESIRADKAHNKQLRADAYNKAVNKFTNSKLGSKYKLHNDPKKELAEVEGTAPKTKKQMSDRTKTALKIGAAATATALAAYGAYKVSKYVNKEHNKIMESKCRSWLSYIDRGSVNANADLVKGYFSSRSSNDSFLRKLDTVATTHGTMKLKPGRLADAFYRRYAKLDDKEIRAILNR